MIFWNFDINFIKQLKSFHENRVYVGNINKKQKPKNRKKITTTKKKKMEGKPYYIKMKLHGKNVYKIIKNM